jgi:hypothetical protein
VQPASEKDHRTLFQAFSQVLHKFPSASPVGRQDRRLGYSDFLHAMPGDSSEKNVTFMGSWRMLAKFSPFLISAC